MKLLTINTHSLIEPDYERKLCIFCDTVCRIKPDIIAMQEVNQRLDSPPVTPGKGCVIREDNHALRVCNELLNKGVKYQYIWQGIKESYGTFEEGVAVLTNQTVTDAESFVISRKNDKKDWKTRAALGIKVNNIWFYSIHTGRDDDTADPFSKQWGRFLDKTNGKGTVFVMGDFNCPHNGAGYRRVIDSGWFDTYYMARHKDDGITVPGAIDGWRDIEPQNMRIDYIFTNEKTDIKSSEVIFNGKNEQAISDHYGVMITL